MDKKEELMTQLLNLYQQYDYIKNDSSAITVSLYIKEKEKELMSCLINKEENTGGVIKWVESLFKKKQQKVQSV